MHSSWPPTIYSLSRLVALEHGAIKCRRRLLDIDGVSLGDRCCTERRDDCRDNYKMFHDHFSIAKLSSFQRYRVSRR